MMRTKCCDATPTYSDADGEGAVLVCRACYDEIEYGEDTWEDAS